MSSKSKTHLVAVRVDGRINEELAELEELTSKTKPDFLREVLVRGMYSYRNELFESSESRVARQIDRSVHSYLDGLLNDDGEISKEINDRFDRLESMINELKNNKKGFFK